MYSLLLIFKHFYVKIFLGIHCKKIRYKRTSFPLSKYATFLLPKYVQRIKCHKSAKCKSEISDYFMNYFFRCSKKNPLALITTRLRVYILSSLVFMFYVFRRALRPALFPKVINAPCLLLKVKIAPCPFFRSQKCTLPFSEMKNKPCPFSTINRVRKLDSCRKSDNAT